MHYYTISNILLGILHIYPMCFDKIYLHFFPFNSSLFPTPLFPPNFMSFPFPLNPLSPFIAACVCIGVKPSTGARIFFQDCILEESWFSLSWHPSIANSFINYLTLPLPIMLGFWLIWSCACSHSSSEFICAVVLSGPSNNGLYRCSICLTLRCFSPLLPWWPLNLGGKGYNIDALFRHKHITVSYYLNFDQMWTSILITIYCKNKFLCTGLRDALICKYRDKDLRRQGGGCQFNTMPI